jgi:hypothetical protein
LALAVPLSRFTSQVGGGSAFYVRPLDHAMSKSIKKIFFVLVSVMALLVVAFILRPGIIPFFAMQADSVLHAGTWEDDPKNWYRAFNEEQPADVKVVHSKYWRSDHFTVEFIYYFEVDATPKWRDTFFAKRDIKLVPPATARSFRTDTHSDDTPGWFAPDPVDRYEVWDKAGYFGSVWIDKTNGHIFFYEAQL